MKGAIPLCTSFDTAGPMARAVQDVAVAIDTLTASTRYASLLQEDVSSLRVGIARKSFFDDLHPDVAACMNQAEDVIRKLVSQVREVEVPVDAFRTIFDAEIYEYHEAMLTKTPELYDPRTLYRLRSCAGISATAYIRERHRLEEFRATAERIFEQVDVVITPTTPAAAPKLADLEALEIPDVRPFEMKHLLRNTAPFSALSWPSTSVPCGFTSDGLPVGMQISSRPGSDSTTLRLAYAYQQATEWGKKPLAIATSN